MTLHPIKIKNQFPFFRTHPDVVYLDSASTTQKPKSVIDTLVSFYTQENANAGRASYTLARKLSEKIEIIRTIVQQFLNAQHPSEIIFTFGATDGFNKIIHSLGFYYLHDGDEVIYCPHDHQSFVLPWFNIQKILKGIGKTIHLVPIRTKNTGSIDQKDLFSKITHRTKVINLTHIHNVYGADNDVTAIKTSLPRPDIIVNVDATQSVGHIPVDVQSLGCDILSFSGHKMFAAQGCGVTYLASWLHDKILPVVIGGGGGLSLDKDSIKITDYTKAWESGTQNYAAMLTLKPAIEFIQNLGIIAIHHHLSALTQTLLHELRSFGDTLQFTPGPAYWPCADGYGILSFSIKGFPSVEIGLLLSDQNIYVRAGTHCMSDHLHEDTLRVSMHAYTTLDDIQRFVDTLRSILHEY